MRFRLSHQPTIVGAQHPSIDRESVGSAAPLPQLARARAPASFVAGESPRRSAYAWSGRRLKRRRPVGARAIGPAAPSADAARTPPAKRLPDADPPARTASLASTESPRPGRCATSIARCGHLRPSGSSTSMGAPRCCLPVRGTKPVTSLGATQLLTARLRELSAEPFGPQRLQVHAERKRDGWAGRCFLGGHGALLRGRLEVECIP